MLDVNGTKSYWIRKTLQNIGLFIASLLCISILTFILIYLTPGDPVAAYMHEAGIPYSAATANMIKAQMGLDKPFYVQYFIWLGNVLQGNLGTSFILKQPVLHVLARASFNTLQLGLFSLIILTLLSLILSLGAVKRPNGILDIIIQGFSLISVSFPNFFLGYLLIIFFAAKLGWLPVSGISQPYAIVLPSITLMMPYLGQTVLFLRKCFLAHLEEAHTINAKLRGVKDYYIMINHLLRNASAPLITITSMNILLLITGSIIVEDIFTWPGLGQMFVKAVQHGDTPLIQGSILLFGVMAIIINNLTQLLVVWIDPKQRHQNRGEF